MHGYVRQLFGTLPRDGIDRNNMIAVFLMGALPAVGGTTISVILYASLVWAIPSLALGRFEFRLTRSDRMLAWAFTIFAVAIVVTALAGDRPQLAPRKLVWLLGFLSPWVVIPRLRAGSGGNYLVPYVTGAAVGAIAAAVMAFVQLTAFGIRAEGGAGNPNVFAVMSLCLMGLGALNLGGRSNRRIILGLGALLFGSLAVFFSLTRGAALIVPFMILLAVAYTPGFWRSIRSWRIVLSACVAIGLVILGAYLAWDWRGDVTIRELEKTIHGDFGNSIGERLRLWSAAVEAIVRSPIWGFGIQNRMDVLRPQDGTAILFPFSHPHNGFLTFALDGGILGLAGLVAMLSAPIALALRAPHDENRRLRLFMAIAVTGAYVSCGMTQIMFNQDVMDSFFILFATVLAASVPDSATQGR